MIRLRDDDIYLTESPTQGNQLYGYEKFVKVHEMIKSFGRKHHLAIIAGEIENYPRLTRYIKKNIDDFELGIHGWQHAAYTTWPKEHTQISLKRAKDKIFDTFSVTPKIFFPPWNKTNFDVAVACRLLDLEVDTDFMSPLQALTGSKAKSLCFHYWHEEEVAILNKWLQLQSTQQ